MDLALLLANAFSTIVREQGVDVCLYRRDLMHMEMSSVKHEIFSPKGKVNEHCSQLNTGGEAVETKRELA